MIRLIEKRDYEKALQIYNYSVINTTNSFEEKEVTIEDFTKRIEEVTKKLVWLVYEEDNQVLGYAYLSPYAKRSAYHITCDLSIYVDNISHQKGIGKALYNAIEIYAKSFNFETIVSIICDENMPSIAFHESLGFIKCGHLDNVGFKMNHYIGIYIYKKSII